MKPSLKYQPSAFGLLACVLTELAAAAMIQKLGVGLGYGRKMDGRTAADPVPPYGDRHIGGFKDRTRPGVDTGEREMKRV